MFYERGGYMVKKEGIMKRVMYLFLALSFFAGLACAADDAKQFVPKKAVVDSNFDGKPDRIETYDESGLIREVQIDTTGNGVYDEKVVYKNGIPFRKEKDTNGDGKADVWIDY